MKSIELLDAINSVRYAAGDETHGQRPVLDGIFVQLDLDRLTMVAANGYVMARRMVMGAFVAEWSGVLPLGAVRALKFLLEESEHAAISTPDGVFTVTTDLARLSIPQMDVRPLPYGRVLGPTLAAPVRDVDTVSAFRALPSMGSYDTGDIVEVAGVRVQRDLLRRVTTGLPDDTKVLIRSDRPAAPVCLEAVHLPWCGVIMPLSTQQEREARHADD